MAAHVAALAQAGRVTIRYHVSGQWDRSYRHRRLIVVRRVRSAITYAIALHELGHVLGPQTGSDLNREWQAWSWAKRHAVWWPAAVQQYRLAALASHQQWAAAARRRLAGPVASSKPSGKGTARVRRLRDARELPRRS